MESGRKLSQIRGLSDAKVDKLREASVKVVEPVFRFVSAKDVQLRRDELCVKVTTGCSDLDNILGGGIECAQHPSR